MKNFIYSSLCLLLSFSCNVPNSESIGLFDLKYSLHYDLNDPQLVESMWDDIHATATLQGIVNRDAPRLFINYVVQSDIEVDTYWWHKYRQPGKWLHDKDTVVYHDIVELIEGYKHFINGVVLYDSSIASTSNVASAIAGIEDLIAVRYDPAPGSLYSQGKGRYPVPTRSRPAP
jgi:hypothetical protein